MRHRYACPIRWADLDLLGHVNNVRYVDYLQEARVDMMRAYRWSGEGGAEEVAEAIVVVRHEVTYLRPLVFGPDPVQIECWVTEIRSAAFTMAYELFHEVDGERIVYARAKTVLSPYRFDMEMPRRLTAEEKEALAPYLEPDVRPRPDRLTVRHDTEGHYPVKVRFSDVDIYRHVNNVVYFEYLQEGRIDLFTRFGGKAPGERDLQVVVAQTNVDYLRPILLREAPYDCWTQVTRLGTTSLTLDSEICDGDLVLARARVVIVFFDPATERATPPPAELRDNLLRLSSSS